MPQQSRTRSLLESLRLLPAFVHVISVRQTPTPSIGEFENLPNASSTIGTIPSVSIVRVYRVRRFT